MLLYNPRLKKTAQTLRRNMTRPERQLWSRIRLRQLKGHQFYRQKTIGNYIVDFYCPAAKLVIEVDGSQHYSTAGSESDKERDDYIERQGLKTIRYSNIDVTENLEGVVESIIDNLP